MKGTVTDAYTPDLRGRILSQEALGGSESSLVDHEIACLDVNGDDLAPVIDLDLGPDFPLVDLVATRSNLFG